MPGQSQTSAVRQLLAHHLASAIDLGNTLLAMQPQAPDTGPGEKSWELNDQFATFRKEMARKREYELLFFTNLSRARYWLGFLERLEGTRLSAVKDFLSATVRVDGILHSLARPDLHDPSGVDIALLMAAAASQLSCLEAETAPSTVREVA